jgi:hypothetical protein
VGPANCGLFFPQIRQTLSTGREELALWSPSLQGGIEESEREGSWKEQLGVNLEAMDQCPKLWL